MTERDEREIDWTLTTWEGSRREQLRRARDLTLRERLQAIEDMAELSERLQQMRQQGAGGVGWGAGHRTEPIRVREPGPGRPAGPDPAILEEIIRRVVAVAQPDRIILFGSAARGGMGPDSDIDLLVVKSGVEHRRRLAQEIHMNLFGVPAAVDVVVVAPEDIERFGERVGTIIRPALREGREIYAA